MAPEPMHTVCGVCGLYYQYPASLDYERNPCPRCGNSNGRRSVELRENLLLELGHPTTRVLPSSSCLPFESGYPEASHIVDLYGISRDDDRLEI